jgi:hypothetical protein
MDLLSRRNNFYEKADMGFTFRWDIPVVFLEVVWYNYNC